MTNTSVLPAAQAGLYREPGIHAHYLEYQLLPNVDADAVKRAIAQALIPIATTGCDDDCYVGVAFGAQAWDRLQPQWRPAELVPFAEVAAKHVMPATQADVFFWLHGEDRGEVMAAALQVQQQLAEVASITLDVSGFKNQASRDLTGFVDGTANPKEEKRIAAAQIPSGLPGAGGCYVFSQKWRHDLESFRKLTVKQQEAVIGRTKQDDIELEGDAMPADSHVSRTDVKVDGVAMKIYRRSTPYYQNADDKGLYFLCFASEVRRIQIQLERMVGATADGISDHLMAFSEPLSGSYWFMPAQADLLQLLKENP